MSVAPGRSGVETLEHGIAFEPVRPHNRPAKLSRRWVLTLFATDLAGFVLSSAIGIALVKYLHPVKTPEYTYATAAVVIALQLFFFERLGLYRRSLSFSVRDELYYLTIALGSGALPLLLLFTILPHLSTSRVVIIASLVASLILVGGARAAVHELRSISEKRSPRRIAIVGREDRATAAAAALAAVDTASVRTIAVEDFDSGLGALRARTGGGLAGISWFAEARNWGCDDLILTEMLPPWVLPVLLAEAARSHIKVAFAPPRFCVHAYSLTLEVDGEQALIVPTQLRACTQPARVVKRVADTILSAAILVAFAPVMVCCALAVKLESPGPVLYRQRRTGLDGHTFDVLKFRSMRNDAERESGPIWTLQNDARVTRVGRFLRRFSLDELPQFVNVLRGEMSIVGPRPERPEFVELFRDALERYDERHLVRPGITGWAQVNLRRTLVPSEAGKKLSYDLFYIEQWSPFLDMYVVAKTAAEFLFHRAA